MSVDQAWLESLHGVNLDYMLGPLFMAHCFNWCLYGLLWLQVYMYFVSFPKDASKFKALVYGVLSIDSVSIALATYSGWVVFVQNWGNTSVFTHLGWSWATVPASSGLVAFIVQSFFAYRIWVIWKNWWMPVFIVMLSGISCGFAFGSAVEVSHIQSFSYIRHRTPSIWLSFGISADFFVCATLSFYLLRSQSIFRTSNKVIIRIVRISIETALVTMLAASVKLYLIFSRQDNMHLLFCLLLPRLYSNAMLGTLNSRSPLFGGGKSFNGDTATMWSEGAVPSFVDFGKGAGIPLPVSLRRPSRTELDSTFEFESDCSDSVIDGNEQVIEYRPSFPGYPPTPDSSITLISPPPSAKIFDKC